MLEGGEVILERALVTRKVAALDVVEGGDVGVDGFVALAAEGRQQQGCTVHTFRLAPAIGRGST